MLLYSALLCVRGDCVIISSGVLCIHRRRALCLFHCYMQSVMCAFYRIDTVLLWYKLNTQAASYNHHYIDLLKNIEYSAWLSDISCIACDSDDAYSRGDSYQQHHHIGNMIDWSLFSIRSWGNGMRSMFIMAIMVSDTWLGELFLYYMCVFHGSECR